jgi:hypothetical protein
MLTNNHHCIYKNDESSYTPIYINMASGSFTSGSYLMEKKEKKDGARPPLYLKIVCV